eukprot:Opistho-2@96692
MDSQSDSLPPAPLRDSPHGSMSSLHEEPLRRPGSGGYGRDSALLGAIGGGFPSAAPLPTIGQTKSPRVRPMLTKFSLTPETREPTNGALHINNEGDLVLGQHIGGEAVTIPSAALCLPVGNRLVTCAPSDLQELGEIGRGAYGAVFKMQHPGSGFVLAVKQIPVDVTEESRKQQLIRELGVLRESTGNPESMCPYIVKYYGAYFKEGDISICMEYMDGCSLDGIYKKTGPVPEPILGKIAVAMVHGLHYLKERHHIIHRDVKPSNVLINSLGEVKLCDFGISGRLENSVAKTYVGTNHYMSPERIQGTKLYDIRADVWSLGISLVELAMGQFPFPMADGRNVFAMLERIVKGPSPTVPADKFSPECVDFLARCLEKQPESRYNYVQLLEHPFIKIYERLPVDVASWAQRVIHACQSDDMDCS